MGNTIGILQPGRIGDIIISLPIAKYYYDRGHKIVWPISNKYFDTFWENIDYVHFIPIADNESMWVRSSRALLERFNCGTIFELLFNFPYTEVASKKWKESGLGFDEYRYKTTNVPFDEKWKLSITRNTERELDLYNKIITNDSYIVSHTVGSNYKVNIDINSGGLSHVKISNVTNNIFDWLTIIERAKKLILVDSCFANLVNQLNFTNHKMFILRSQPIETPILRNNWEIIHP